MSIGVSCTISGEDGAMNDIVAVARQDDAIGLAAVLAVRIPAPLCIVLFYSSTGGVSNPLKLKGY
jgi:hypothetical protein